jgi:mRNA interferase HigB
VGELTVFNLKGNAYRLIVYIDYSHQSIYIKDLLSHADYSKQQWQ